MAEISGPPAIGVKLDNEGDWHLWLSAIKNIALEAQIWQYINPRLPTEPPEPTEPTKPTAEQITGDPTATVHSLSQANLSRYSTLLTIYQTERAEYQTFLRARQRIINVIYASVTRSNQHYLAGLHTPYQQLRKLRTIFAPSPRLYTQRLRMIWRSHLDSAQNKSSNKQAWLTRIEALYNECVNANVPEVLNTDALLYDFLTAIRIAGYENFFQAWFQQIFVNNQDIDFYRLVHHFREAQRVEVTQSQASGVAFAATLNGQPTGQYPRNPCVCGGNHAYKRCYYLNPVVRPADWLPRAETIAKINDLLKNDPALVNQVKKVLPNIKHPIAFASIAIDDADFPTETITF